MKTLIPAVKATRVSVSEDGTYAVGPTLDSIAAWLPGYGISPEAALNMITVYQCVRLVSNTCAQLPFLLYRRLPKGGKDRATDHPLYRTLHLQPNPDLSSFAWRRLMMVHLMTWGNAYAEIVEGGLGTRYLYPVRPDRMEVTREDGIKVFDYLDPRGGKVRMKAGTVFHVTGLSTDGLVGRSPITDLRSTIRLARTAEQFGDSFFRNGARPATVLKHPKTLSDPAVARLAAQMEGLRGSGNAGKTVVLEEGMDFDEVGIPPEDAQFMQTRLFQKRELAGAYGIPPHKIADLERATFSNIEEQNLDYIIDCMGPYFANIEQEITIQLLGGEEEFFAEFLVDGYLRGDTEKRNKAYAIRWQHGTLSADEWRAKENENPLPDGLGEDYYVAVNYQAVSEDVAPRPSFRPLRPKAPELSVVKAMKQFDCPDCGKLINRLAAPGTVGYCPRCKAERTLEAGEPEVAA